MRRVHGTLPRRSSKRPRSARRRRAKPEPRKFSHDAGRETVRRHFFVLIDQREVLETFDLGELHGAVGDALRLGAIGYDAVKHLLLCRIERRPPRLDLDVYPYLPRARVATTAASSYLSLLDGTAS